MSEKRGTSGVESVAVTFSSATGKEALEYLRRALGYDSSQAERAAEIGSRTLADRYCPHRTMFQAGMREAFIVIEDAIKVGLGAIDRRSSAE